MSSTVFVDKTLIPLIVFLSLFLSNASLGSLSFKSILACFVTGRSLALLGKLLVSGCLISQDEFATLLLVFQRIVKLKITSPKSTNLIKMSLLKKSKNIEH